MNKPVDKAPVNLEDSADEVAEEEMDRIERDQIEEFLSQIQNVSSPAYYTKPDMKERKKFKEGKSDDPLWIHNMKELPLGNYEEEDMKYLHLKNGAILTLYQQTFSPSRFSLEDALDIEQLGMFSVMQRTRGRGGSERKMHQTQITERRGEEKQTVKVPDESFLDKLR